jgi:hypothetical protein
MRNSFLSFWIASFFAMTGQEQKSPEVSKNSRGILEVFALKNIYATIPHREVRVRCQDAVEKLFIGSLYRFFFGLQIFSIKSLRNTQIIATISTLYDESTKPPIPVADMSLERF